MRWALALALAAACLFASKISAASPGLRTCVTVVADSPEEQASLRSLVETELDQHPSHHAVGDDCQSFLRVELIDAGKDGRFLTGRINTQVPHRVQVAEAGLADAIRRLLVVMLHNDPVLLRGPREQNWASKSLEDLRTRSLMYFGFELFESAFWLDGRVSGLPGVALTGRREIDALYIGLRLSGAYSPSRTRDELRMTSLFGASVELMFHAAPLANTSLFGGFSVGLSHQRFRGPSPYYAPGVLRNASQSGAELGLSGGVETLRVTDTRLTVFGRIALPAFVSEDQDDAVVDAWLPTATVGVGMAF
jgi:hypothetical protein